MAQKKDPAATEPSTEKKPSTKEGMSIYEETLDVQDVRAAVLRLVELAAAFEAHGFEVSRADSNDSHEADLRTLTEVTNQLLQNVKHSRRDQRDVLLNTLIVLLSEMYREEGDVPTPERKQEILDLFSGLRIEPTENQLKELVKVRGDKEGSIKKLRGPIEAAKAAIAKTAHISVGTTGVGRRRASDLPFFRATLGRWITFAERKEYVDSLCEEHLQVARQHQIKLHHLGEIDHSTGAALDLVAEKWLNQVATKEGMTTFIFSDVQSPDALELRRQFLARWRQRCVLYAALADVAPEHLAAAVENEPSMSDGLRKSVFALVHASQARDEAATVAAANDLAWTIANEVIESASSNFAKLFGPLETEDK